MPGSVGTFDEDLNSPFEGGVGDVPLATGTAPLKQDIPRSPKGCFPPQGGIFEGVFHAALRRHVG